MNYMSEIKAFQGFAQDKSLSSGQIALWYALMYINNKCGWAEWFTAAGLSLELNSGLSRQGVVKARNVLKQQGLIDFRSNGTRACSYRIIPLTKSDDAADTSDSVQAGIQNSVQTGVQSSIQVGVQTGVQNSSALNKLNKTKRDKTKQERGASAGMKRPSLEEIEAYRIEQGLDMDSRQFYDHYQSNGWYVGKTPMKDWKSAVRNWARMEQKYGTQKPEGQQDMAVSYDVNAFETIGLTVPKTGGGQ